MTTFNAKDQEALAMAGEEIARINIQIAELTELKNNLLAVFKNPQTGLVPRAEPYVFGKVQVKVSTHHRLDDGLAMRLLDASSYRNVSKTVLDTAKARKVLDTDALEKITKKFDNKIEVKPR